MRINLGLGGRGKGDLEKQRPSTVSGCGIGKCFGLKEYHQGRRFGTNAIACGFIRELKSRRLKEAAADDVTQFLGLLGHESVETTQIYTHVTCRSLGWASGARWIADPRPFSRRRCHPPATLYMPSAVEPWDALSARKLFYGPQPGGGAAVYYGRGLRPQTLPPPENRGTPFSPTPARAPDWAPSIQTISPLCPSAATAGITELF
jgi:hypothetical protein